MSARSGRSISELQAAFDAREFAELIAFQRYYEPVGEARDDLRAALVAYHAGTAFGNPDRRTMSDFVLKFREPFQDLEDEVQQHAEHVRAKMAAFRARRKA